MAMPIPAGDWGEYPGIPIFVKLILNGKTSSMRTVLGAGWAILIIPYAKADATFTAAEVCFLVI